MKTNLSSREKVLLIILGVLIAGMLYIQLFYKPFTDKISSQQTALGQLQTTETIEEAKTKKLKEMKKVISEQNVENGNADAKIPDFNNLENVMTQLNAILTPAEKYDISFKDTSETNGLVYRPLELDITAANYAAAREILNNLTKCPYRCSIDSIEMTTAQNSEDTNVMTQVVNCKVGITFYEKAK